MLSFDIRSLASKAVQVDGRLATDDPVWEEGDVRPAHALHVPGRLSSAGDDRYYFSGRMHGDIGGECRRCLTDVSAPVDDEVHLLFADEGDPETDDQDVYRVDPKANDLDMRPAIREQWLLVVPTYLQCREDCKGLCPSCGADLNQGACDCAPATDSRWDALRKVRDSHS
jgi:uncharacterized protein